MAEVELEWQTSRRLVDPKLESQGWQVTHFPDSASLDSYERRAIREFPTQNGPADYALRVDGVLASKQQFVMQAWRQSRCLSR